MTATSRSAILPKLLSPSSTSTALAKSSDRGSSLAVVAGPAGPGSGRAYAAGPQSGRFQRSDADLDCRAALPGKIHHGGGDGKVLKAHSGTVEERDLVGRCPTRMGAVDHLAKLRDLALADQAGGDRMLGLADRDRLGDLVGEDRRLGEEGRVQFLLAP